MVGAGTIAIPLQVLLITATQESKIDQFILYISRYKSTLLLE